MVFKAKASYILSVCFIFLFTSPCQPICIPRLNASNLLEARRGINNFGINLHNELVIRNPTENVLISPLSVHATLCVGRMGAVGKTADEIDGGLGFHNKSTNEISASYYYLLKGYQGRSDVKIANKLYVKDGIEVQENFEKALTKRLFSSIDHLKFTDDNAEGIINSWVEGETNNLIKDFIPSGTFDDLTAAVLINAIYFKGDWVYQFPERNTKVEPFYLNAAKSFNVQMMHVKGNFKYAYLSNLGATALEMKYNNSDLSMLIILPNSRTGLNTVLKNLETTPLSDITNLLEFMNVIVSFPKFKLAFKAELEEPLSNMGISRMFSDAAEFDNMLKSEADLSVSKVIHQTFIEVNEKGASAAAVTEAEMGFRMLSSDPEFTVNKSFYFAIKDDNNTKLFEGIINNEFI